MACLSVLLLSYLGLGVIILAALRPDYSHIEQTISELGARDAPYGGVANGILFFPVGVGLWTIAIAVYPDQAWTAVLAASLGTGYALGAIFPCDPGLPAVGSRQQAMHELAGFIEYAGSAVAVFELGRVMPHAPWPLVLLPAYVPLAAASALIPRLRPWRGLLQRIAEVGLFTRLSFSLWAF